MSDYYELDFLDVESDKGGDAITLRYKIGDEVFIHVIDGGYQSTGELIVEHINKYYDNPGYIDNVVLTHQDNDHAGGLRKILEEFKIGSLWMLRPWLYAEEIIGSFSRFKSVENLIERLKEVYSNIAALEEIANEKGIKIKEPFQGARIGVFSVLSPTKKQYLDLVINSEKTPDVKEESMSLDSFFSSLKEGVKFIPSLWGKEVFPEDGTSCENEMSIVQYASIADHKILLTGDAGRQALDVAANYAPVIGISLPGIDKFQVPHHGSRHNVSTEILDRWLGKKLETKLDAGNELFRALISASSNDENHPRKAVVRALIHRGAKVVATKGKGFCTGNNAPQRAGWSAITPLDYPEDQEE
jgi:hypothetical protein